MDDSKFGSRNKHGDWAPFQRVVGAPLFVWPPQLQALLKWVFGYPGYILPWNLFYALLAVAVWLWLTPDLQTMKAFSPGWVAIVLLRNMALVFVWYGLFHLRLYMQRGQGNAFKYNARWLSKDSKVFLFRNQTRDNLFWVFTCGVPIWTAYEVVMLWAFASGHISLLSWEEYPLLFIALMLVLPLFREFHFYCIHRLIHWPPLYRSVHRLHHTNANPGPWSGISMHPVEHVLYFSGVLVHAIVLSHPVHALFHLLHAGLSPVQSHSGFDKLVVGENTTVDTHSLAHYLHHKHFEVNYSDGAIPLDRIFGTFHDGSPESDEALKLRMRERRATQNH